MFHLTNFKMFQCALDFPDAAEEYCGMEIGRRQNGIQGSASSSIVQGRQFIGKLWAKVPSMLRPFHVVFHLLLFVNAICCFHHSCYKYSWSTQLPSYLRQISVTLSVSFRNPYRSIYSWCLIKRWWRVLSRHKEFLHKSNRSILFLLIKNSKPKYHWLSDPKMVLLRSLGSTQTVVNA